MKFGIVIPVYNEEQYLEGTVASLLKQTLKPEQIVLVDDGSTDRSWNIIQSLQTAHPSITGVQTDAASQHVPGAKVVRAFHAGQRVLGEGFDVICKFDSDLIFPPDYLSEVAGAFQANPKLGICGGICLIEKAGSWQPEVVADADHLRGALKAYRMECFRDIGGLKAAMGWDTVDELLAAYHGWQVKVLPGLQVKHLRVTGKTYTPASRYLKGEALYMMGYGWLLAAIASAKIALNEGNLLSVRHHLKGYFSAARCGKPRMVTRDEARFIRRLRWSRMRNKFSGRS